MQGLNEIIVSGVAQHVDNKLVGRNGDLRSLNFTLAGEVDRQGRRVKYYVPVTMLGKSAEHLLHLTDLQDGALLTVKGGLELLKWRDQEDRPQQRVKLKGLRATVLDATYPVETHPENKGVRLQGGLNSAVVGGNLTRDPELRDAGGSPVLDIDIAINERYQKAGQWVDADPVYVTVTLWGDLATTYAGVLKKGSSVTVSGFVNQDSWTDKEGQKRATLKVTATEVMLIGVSSPYDQKASAQQQTEPSSPRRTPTPGHERPAHQRASASRAAASSPAAQEPARDQNLRAADVQDDDLPF